jgi:predicted metal-dependent phosphoesterase TrpH
MKLNNTNMKYDLHTHSKYSSDGYIEPKMMVKIAAKVGLSGIAVTDHNTIKGGLEAKKYENSEIEVIVGSEILTDKGEIIGIFLTDEIISTSFIDVVDEIKSQNGIVVVPHPFDGIRSTAFHPTIADAYFFDTVEIFNSRCIRRLYNDMASSYAVFNNLNVVAGSDAHFENEIGNAGVNTKSENIKEAIFNNDCTVFGKRSNIINPVTTKLLKIWRGSSSK